ncbi:hypothetical protein NCCP1664_10300 [Zafaria cholistanensis]|uniref:DUF937 domain-containing protein n=1 Tax=Zafaria cholistanensis TaxID=1682741 RepID=A0A5A7NNL3_9MICC|nr:DUF937 domain-containing protein [Zafaria cholistanensis]GER22533.1 hypothetical protein NCCP1664_10300 [Zafaria cholistanensis]
MPAIQDFIGQIPIDQLAGKLGTDRQTALAAVHAALPSLLAGMQANASSPEGANALRSAIAQHDGSLLEGGVDLDQVDEQDGEKIVGHVLGGNRTALESQLNGATPEGFDLGGLVRKALPLLAPLVMSFLAKSGGRESAEAGGTDLGSLLGGLLGGPSPAAGGQSPAAGGPEGIDLGGILGSLFGRK